MREARIGEKQKEIFDRTKPFDPFSLEDLTLIVQDPNLKNLSKGTVRALLRTVGNLKTVGDGAVFAIDRIRRKSAADRVESTQTQVDRLTNSLKEIERVRKKLLNRLRVLEKGETSR